MTDAIGPSISDVARALMEARQTTSRAAATAPQPAATGTGRTANEGDSVTLSAEAQKSIKLDGSVTPIDMSKVRLITPQGLRSDAETGLQAVMDELGIEGDLHFAITVNGDGSIAVAGDDPQAEALEQAINADPALQKTLRDMEVLSGHSLTMPAMKEALDWMREHEDQPAPRSLFDGVDALRQRIEGASYTFTMTGGTLTTAFVDAAGESFGGIGTETGLDGRWT
ncbi:hypothetical protein [Pelagibius sp. 7325]|uniref:hypothetical protein n=1 Tax=Pelagibius sp. 7325 TaxID=3131994 RepID=UPI0030EEBEAB